jgi:hypothetical protein
METIKSTECSAKLPNWQYCNIAFIGNDAILATATQDGVGALRTLCHRHLNIL